MTNDRKNPSRWAPLVVLFLATVAATAVGLWVVRSRWALPAPPVYGSLPDFSLTERSGRLVTRADLAGHVWIADFVFTRCPGPCPLMTAHLARLQKSLIPSTSIYFVSFTADPDYDTPAVLSAYADRFGATKDRWWFLTGRKEAIYTLAAQGFHLGVGENPAEGRLPDQGPVFHSTRFVLVDAQGRIRGYYDSESGDERARLLRDVRALLREKTS